MDRKSGDIEVEHVYDLAAEVGDEFQKIIDNLGSDVVKSLMPKVIRVLEHLEVLALRKDDIDSELDGLKLNIYQLEQYKRDKEEHHNRYELDMELIDDNWRKENLQLTQFVNQLRHENIKLTNCLIDKERTLSQSLTDLQMKAQMEIDSEITSLKESINRSEYKIQTLTKEMDSKNEEIEKLYDQIETVMQQNRELRRRLKNYKIQGKHSTETKADLQLNPLIEMSQHLVPPNNDIKDMESEQQIQLIEESNQQPFSLAELRNILLEKNNLKTRVIELEEEINQLKQLINNSCQRKLSIHNQLVIENEKDELPVEGPINREPEDKLFPGRQPNRILRFFPSLSWPRIKRP